MQVELIGDNRPATDPTRVHSKLHWSWLIVALLGPVYSSHPGCPCYSGDTRWCSGTNVSSWRVCLSRMVAMRCMENSQPNLLLLQKLRMIHQAGDVYSIDLLKHDANFQLVVKSLQISKVGIPPLTNNLRRFKSKS